MSFQPLFFLSFFEPFGGEKAFPLTHSNHFWSFVRINSPVQDMRKQQQAVGRFWYRFPTGESGSDVYSRVRTWWESLMQINLRPNYERVDTVIVVTHGLVSCARGVVGVPPVRTRWCRVEGNRFVTVVQVSGR